MRLNKTFADAIVDCLGRQEGAIGSKVYLVGSRADDSKKGGDIDLLWIVPGEKFKQLKAVKSQLMADLREATDDQRVDLIIAVEEDIQMDPFLSSVFSGKKSLLKSWV